MRIGILGGGLAGIALAYFLQNNDRIESIEILEKESEPGGLCRSFHINGICYDIGPHAIFSRDDEMLNLMIPSAKMFSPNRNRLLLWDVQPAMGATHHSRISCDFLSSLIVATLY